MLLGFAWIGLTESTSPLKEGSTTDASKPNRTSALIYSLISGLLGARLIFVIMHLPYFEEHLDEIMAMWQGGLSASGGLIGAVLGVFVLTGRSRRPFWDTLDDIAFPAMILSITAWIGNWFDGVAYGKQVAHQWAWLMNSDPFSNRISRWPTQLVGLLFSLLAFITLYRVSSRLPTGVLGCITGTLIALILAVVGVFRADPSMLILGQRVDMLVPALLSLIGFGMTFYRWRRTGSVRS